jgi:hypothetical protein
MALTPCGEGVTHGEEIVSRICMKTRELEDRDVQDKRKK